MMSLYNDLPICLQKSIFKHGLENDSLSFKEDKLYVECDDIEQSFDLRSDVLDLFSCRLISHPITKKPTLEIDDVLNQEAF